MSSKSLTLAALCEYDDFLTKHLIDELYFWITTHKACREPALTYSDAQVGEIHALLRRHVFPQKSRLADALVDFMRLDNVRSFCSDLTAAQKTDFERHARKYLNIYRPEAAFEISATERYGTAKAEACILAVRDLNPGEILSQLCGTFVAMTQDEEDYYENDQQDFSILHSSRLGAMCLFLGPARFVNHECEPNAAFVTTGVTITLTVIKPIRKGEEVTVFYSPDYFGPDNVECKCACCERRGANGYDPANNIRTAERQRSKQDGSSQQHPQKHIESVDVDMLTSGESMAAGTAPMGATGPSGQKRLSGAGGVADKPDSFAQVNGASRSAAPTNGHVHHAASNRSSERDSASIAGDSAHDEEAEESSEVATNAGDNDTESQDRPRRGLRPRAGLDYFHSRRKAELNSAAAAEMTRREKYPRRADDPSIQWCSDCAIEPSRSNADLAGVRGTLLNLDDISDADDRCNRCIRHAELYDIRWPRRVPKLTAAQLAERASASGHNTFQSGTNSTTQYLRDESSEPEFADEIDWAGLPSKVHAAMLHPRGTYADGRKYIVRSWAASMYAACFECRKARHRCSKAVKGGDCCRRCKKKGFPCVGGRYIAYIDRPDDEPVLGSPPARRGPGRPSANGTLHGKNKEAHRGRGKRRGHSLPSVPHRPRKSSSVVRGSGTNGALPVPNITADDKKPTDGDRPTSAGESLDGQQKQRRKNAGSWYFETVSTDRSFKDFEPEVLSSRTRHSTGSSLPPAELRKPRRSKTLRRQSTLRHSVGRTSSDEGRNASSAQDRRDSSPTVIKIEDDRADGEDDEDDESEAAGEYDYEPRTIGRKSTPPAEQTHQQTHRSPRPITISPSSRDALARGSTPRPGSGPALPSIATNAAETGVGGSANRPFQVSSSSSTAMPIDSIAHTSSSSSANPERKRRRRDYWEYVLVEPDQASKEPEILEDRSSRRRKVPKSYAEP
ncbi:histone lysine methyltransferase Set9 [Savitreella phatthalungensis]